MVLSKSKKQASVLYVCTILGTAVGLLVSVLNTRSLLTTDYGDVRYVNNLIAFFSGILLFGFFVSGSRLLALSKSETETREMKGVLVAILLATYLIMCLIMAVSSLVHHFVLHKEFSHLFYVVIPVCGSVICLNYLNTTSQGDNSIYTIAAGRLLPSVVYLVVAYLIYHYYGASSKKMLLLQNGISMVLLLALIFSTRPKFTHLRASFCKLREENKRYGLQVYIGSLANVSVQYVAGISLGLFGADNSNVGFYTLALTVSMPLSMLPQIIGTTYFKQFATSPSIAPTLLRTTGVLTVVSLIIFVLLIHPVVRLLYPATYGSIALYASFLAIACMFQGLGDVFNRFLGAHGKGTYLRDGAFISGGVALLGYIVAVYFWGISGAIITRISSSLVYFACMVYFYRKFIDAPKDTPSVGK